MLLNGVNAQKGYHQNADNRKVKLQEIDEIVKVALGSRFREIDEIVIVALGSMFTILPESYFP